MTLLTGAGGSAAVIAAGFVATPFLLRYLGAERYGAFQAAVGWFGYATMLEFGLAGALQVVFARALGTGDRDGVVAGARAGVRAYLRVGLLMLAAGAGLAAAMPWLTQTPADLAGELWAGGGLFLATFALIPLAVFRPLIEAEQRGYVVHLLTTAQAVTVIGVSVGLAAAGWGLVGQFAGLVAGAAVFYLGLAWDGLRRHPEVVRGPAGPRPALWGLSWPTLLFNLSGRLSLLSDNLVVAGLLGPTAVAQFHLTQRLIAAAGGQVMAVGVAAWAGLIDLHYRGEHEVFARRLAQLTRLTAGLGVALLLPTAVWNRVLIGLWVGPDQYAGPAVTWLAAAAGGGQAVLALWMWPLTAAGKVRSVVPAVLTATAVNLAVSLGGTATVGLPGPLLGTVTAAGTVSWWWVLTLLRRTFGVAPTGLVRAALRPAVVAAPYGLGLALLADSVPAYDPTWAKAAKWAALAGWLAGGAAGYLALAWVFALPADDRREWIGRFRRRAGG